MVGTVATPLEASVLAAKLAEITAEFDLRAKASITVLGDAIAKETERNLSIYGPHSPHTRTPSPPGRPPAQITSNLRQSVGMTEPTGAPGFWQVQVFVAMPYAIYQEKGTRHIPPRPFLLPAAEKVAGATAMLSAIEPAWIGAGHGTAGLSGLLSLWELWKAVKEGAHIGRELVEHPGRLALHTAKHTIKHHLT